MTWPEILTRYSLVSAKVASIATDARSPSLETGDLVEGLLALGCGRHGGVVGRMSHHQQDIGLLGRRAMQGLIQEAHRIGGVGEGRQAGLMQGRNQEPGGDADRFWHVIGFVRLTGGIETPTLTKDHDQPGRDLQERFVGVGAQRLEGFDPLGSGPPLIKGDLLAFRRLANCASQRTLPDHGEMPGLQIGAARRRAGRHQAGLDDLPCDRSITELPHRVASRDRGIKGLGLGDHLRLRQILAVGQGDGFEGRHQLSINQNGPRFFCRVPGHYATGSRVTEAQRGASGNGSARPVGGLLRALSSYSPTSRSAVMEHVGQASGIDGAQSTQGIVVFNGGQQALLSAAQKSLHE